MQFLLVYKNVESQLPWAKEDLNSQRASYPSGGTVPLLPLSDSFRGDAPKLFRLLPQVSIFQHLSFGGSISWGKYLPSLPLAGSSCSIPQSWGFNLDHWAGVVTAVQKTQPFDSAAKARLPPDHSLPLSLGSHLALPWESSPAGVPAPERLCNTSLLCFRWRCMLAASGCCFFNNLFPH